MSEQFETLRTFIQSHTAQMVELETLLNGIPALAPENGGDGESKKCAALVEWLKKNGITDLKQYDAPDSRVSSGVRPNVVATIPGEKNDYAVWCMAHMDVVPAGELSLWKTDPFKLVEKDGVIYGRGVEDNQQGLVSGVFAALAFVQQHILPEHTIKLLFMADEEVGSAYGMCYLVKNHLDIFGKNDIILIPDGGDAKGETIEVAEKNILWLRFHTVGKQSHGSRPDEGRNAFLAASDLALRINDMERKFNKKNALFAPAYSTFQPTMKNSNVPSVNIIPGDDVFCCDCRILPQYTLDQVRAEVSKRVAAVEKKYGVTIETTELQAAQSPATPIHAPVVQKLSQAIKEVHGVTAKTIGIGGGTVGAELRAAGYDCAVWSTMDETAHQPNEYCLLKNIVCDAETIAFIAMS